MGNNETQDQNIRGLGRISRNLSEVLIGAFELANKRNATHLNAMDVFLSILQHRNNIAARLLEKLGVDVDATKESMLGQYNQQNADLEVAFGEEAKQLLTSSFLLSSELNHVYVGTEHMLLAILRQDDLEFVRDLAEMGFNFDFVKQSILNFGIYQPGIFSRAIEQPEDDDQQQSSLSFFARNMNDLANEGRFLKVWGRDQEIERLIHILSRRTKNNPILVGEAGVGKTAIVEGLVQRIIKGDVPRSFKNKKVVQLDLSAIIAGSKIRGDVEERLLGIVGEMAQDKDLIMFIDEIHMIVGAGAAGSGNSMDIANILKPYLTNGDLRVVGATTWDEYQKYFEEDDALARRFQPVPVNEIGLDDALKVLEMLRPEFERFHKVKITDEAIEEAVILSDRYITNKYLPDKAIDVIDEASSAKKIALEKFGPSVSDYKQQLAETTEKKNKALDENDLEQAAQFRKEEKRLMRRIKMMNERNSKQSASAGSKKLVNAEDIRKVIASWSKVPVTTMTSTDIRSLQDLEKNLGKRIIGQNKAISQVAAALKRARVGISDANRPMASFLFLGPTGVGKTESAKEIARTMFGDEDALIQVDMSEFMEQHSISKLIGSPPGYVGFQEGGQLTEKVKRRPYSVVLFDEIEKAHPDMVNILLQILEEGHLQDGKGRRVNFKNTIIILTSNIGADEIGKDSLLGFGIEDETQDLKEMDSAYQRLEETVLEELKDTLPPEFLNRIDDVIVFRGLDETDSKKITKILFEETNKRLVERGVQLVPTPGVVALIAQKGFSKDYGARNLRRKLQELIENPLADWIIANGFTKKDRHQQPKLVRIVKDGEIVRFED